MSELVQPIVGGNMIAAKKVKIRANKTISVGEAIIKEGQEAEVDEETAAEFCDKKFQSVFAFAGERSAHDSQRHVYARATRIG